MTIPEGGFPIGLRVEHMGTIYEVIDNTPQGAVLRCVSPAPGISFLPGQDLRRYGVFDVSFSPFKILDYW